jgi:hypothetical protein
MPTAHVLHITAYPDDPGFRQHVEDVHGGEYDSRDIISKLSATWAEALMKRLDELYHGELIQRQLGLVFPATSVETHARRPYGREASPEGSFTNRLADLVADIIVYWDHLDEATRDRVKSSFHVADESKPIRVSLRPSHEH